MLSQQRMKKRSDKNRQSEHREQDDICSNRVKYKALKCRRFTFSVIFIGAVLLMPTYALIQPNIEESLDLGGFKTITEQTATIARLMNAIFLQNHFQLELVTMEDVIAEVLDVPNCIAKIINFWKKVETFRPTFELAFNSDVKDVANVLLAIKKMVPFTEKERSNIVGLTDFLLAGKAKLSESKKLDADIQREMKNVDVDRLLKISNARDIASQFAQYHRTLVFYQKREFLNFFHYFRSNGLELARKIDDLPPEEKRAAGQIWHRIAEGNETEDEMTILNFLKAVVVTEQFLSRKYSRPEGNLTLLAKVLIKLNGITGPAFKYETMRASIEALKITSLGQSEEVSNAERSLAQLEGVYSSLAHEKYRIGGSLEDFDRVFKSFFTEEPAEDWTTVIWIAGVIAYALVFVAVVILCCVYKWEFKIADVKKQK
uniref:WSN domain-containing protein n=1 Tax=Caenorhabditis japonica TaxID=281687 RepID=A0A8R1ESH5_CAEJA